MKKLILLSVMLIAINLNLSAQYGHRGFQKESKRGTIVLSAGVLFTVIGIATPSENTYVNGSIGNTGILTPTPIYKQTARIAAITTGITLTITGFITMLYERKR
jgi:hypothetical protein